jgi:hypothetical protein
MALHLPTHQLLFPFSVSEETCQFWYTLSKDNPTNSLQTIMNLGGSAMSVRRRQEVMEFIICLLKLSV